MPLIINRAAGTGVHNVPKSGGDDGPAIKATLNGPKDVSEAPDGSLYITELALIRRIAPDGMMRAVAGTGVNGYSGDGGTATSAKLGGAALSRVAIGLDGSLFFADTSRIRKVDPKGIITTIAGTGNGGYSGDNGPATEANIIGSDLAVAADGSIYLAEGTRIRRISSDGIITTIAGHGMAVDTGD